MSATAAAFLLAACSHPNTPARPATSGSAAALSVQPFSGTIPAPFTSTQCSLDTINGQPALSARPVAAGATVAFRGWAGNGQGHPADGFVLVMKGPQNAYAVTLHPDVNRPDVASALHAPAMAASGFDFSVTLDKMPAGAYALYVVDPSDGAMDCNVQRTLTVR